MTYSEKFRKYFIEIDDFPLTKIRSYFIEYISNEKDWQKPIMFNFITICDNFATFLVNKNIVDDPIPTNQSSLPISFDPDGIDCYRIKEVLWSLVTEQVIFVYVYPGDSLYYSLTNYGKKVVTSELPIPHDPDGYLARVKSEIPNIDEIIFTYLCESIHAYNINNLLSATTTLGCASEKALLILISAFTDALSDAAKEKFQNKIQGRFIKNQFDEYRRSFTSYEGKIPDDIKEGIDIGLNAIFEMFRETRNEAGHPTGKQVSKEMIFDYLNVFIHYCKKIYKLIDYFQNNKLTTL